MNEVLRLLYCSARQLFAARNFRSSSTQLEHLRQTPIVIPGADVTGDSLSLASARSSAFSSLHSAC
jgi:quinolinate synthase